MKHNALASVIALQQVLMHRALEFCGDGWQEQEHHKAMLVASVGLHYAQRVRALIVAEGEREQQILQGMASLLQDGRSWVASIFLVIRCAIGI